MTSVAQQSSLETLHPSSKTLALPLCAFRFPYVDDVDLYSVAQDHRTLQLICGRKRELAPEEMKELARRGVHQLLVKNTDAPAVAEALLNSLEAIAAAEDISFAERAFLIQTAGSYSLDRAYHLVSCNPFVLLAQRFGRCIAVALRRQDASPADVYPALLHDERPFVHATNVAFYAVCLARLLKMPEHEIAPIAVGAMLHDIGKRGLPPSLLTKTGRFSRSEREQWEAFPQRAYEDLCGRRDIGFGQLMMVYQQQERGDGSGFPVGLVADEIHPWAKLLAVVDVFDEATSRAGDCVDQSANVLAQLACAEAQFDNKAAKCWISAFQSA